MAQKNAWSKYKKEEIKELERGKSAWRIASGFAAGASNCKGMNGQAVQKTATAMEGSKMASIRQLDERRCSRDLAVSNGPTAHQARNATPPRLGAGDDRITEENSFRWLAILWHHHAGGVYP